MIENQINVVFVVDASSDAPWDDMEAMKKLISNLIQTFKVSDANVMYSLVAFGETTKLLVTFSKSAEKDFNVEVVNIDKIGGPRNVDDALDFVDKQLYGSRAGFPQMVRNGVVIVLTTGSFNGLRNQGLNSVFERLSSRNVDPIFVDTVNGDLGTTLGGVLTNISTTDGSLLPSLLSKLSTRLARKGSKYISQSYNHQPDLTTLSLRDLSKETSSGK